MSAAQQEQEQSEVQDSLKRSAEHGESPEEERPAKRRKMSAAHEEEMEEAAAPASDEEAAPKKKGKPARRQLGRIKPAEDDKPRSQWFNIWYGLESNHGQPRRRFRSHMKPAKTRCKVKRDAGWTQADDNKDAYFCLKFARGCCVRGSECGSLHRIPEERDEKRLPWSHDIFGRQRFGTDREDLGGVGSFNRDNTTLYVGSMGQSDASMETVLLKHFKEWGPVDHVRLLIGRGCGFVTFKRRSSAEFANEAMKAQALNANEVLDVRWATVDPNPTANDEETQEKRSMHERKQLALMDLATQAFQAAGDTIPPKEGAARAKKKTKGGQRKAAKAAPDHESAASSCEFELYDGPSVAVEEEEPAELKSQPTPTPLTAVQPARVVVTDSAQYLPSSRAPAGPSGLRALANYDSDSE